MLKQLGEDSFDADAPVDPSEAAAAAAAAAEASRAAGASAEAAEVEEARAEARRLRAVERDLRAARQHPDGADAERIEVACRRAEVAGSLEALEDAAAVSVGDTLEEAVAVALALEEYLTE